MRRSLVPAAVAIGFLAAPEAAAEVATGCLTKSGRITKLALGDEPARPCGRRETEISLELADPGMDDSIETFAVELEQAEEHEIAPGILLSCHETPPGNPTFSPNVAATVFIGSPYLSDIAMTDPAGSFPPGAIDPNEPPPTPQELILSDHLLVEDANSGKVDRLSVYMETQRETGGSSVGCRFWGRFEADHIPAFDLLTEEAS